MMRIVEMKMKISILWLDMTLKIKIGIDLVKQMP